MLNLLFIFLFSLFLFLSIGFLTLSERYFLGLSQNRVSSGKVSFFGFMQMIFDGLKLFLNELILLNFFDFSFMFFCSFFSFFLMLFFFSFLPIFFNNKNFNWIFFLLFLLVGLTIMLLLMISFFSKSKYSFLGCLRASGSGLSFDIVFLFFLVFFIFILKEMNFFLMNMIFFLISFLLIFLILILVEVGRIPFDFSEGESELVSGFNTELSSLFFVLIFLTEYGFLIFYSFLINYIFFYNNLIMGFFVLFLVIMIRAVLPRLRFDFMMKLCWLIILPFLLIMFFLFIFLFY